MHRSDLGRFLLRCLAERAVGAIRGPTEAGTLLYNKSGSGPRSGTSSERPALDESILLMAILEADRARRDDPFDLSGKTALVTGGARGLGFAMARALGNRGARVMLFDVNAEESEAAAERLHDDNIEALGAAGDVTDPADSERAVARVVDAWGALDICVNNAGVSGNMAAVDVTPAEWRRIIDVNLMGVFFVAQAAGRRMIVQKSGSIVNIASMSGLIVNVPQQQSVYNISKAGVIMATKSLASEWAEYGIRVNAIAPGYMRTEMTARYFDAAGDWSQQWLAATPMRRPGEPEELGGAVVYLASSASSFTTGAVLVIDGGYIVR